MDQQAVLTAFDEGVRQRPEPDGLGGRVERDEGIVRCTGGRGWIGVVWANLDAARADEVIAAQVDHFASASRPWEWKHYSYDSPADLPERLVKAGFRPEPYEVLLVAELARLSQESSLPSDAELRPVTDEHGVEALMQVHKEVFGESQDAIGEMLLAALTPSPASASVAATVVIADDRPIAAGWVEFHRGTDFASLGIAQFPPGAAAACFARWLPTTLRWQRLRICATSLPTRLRTVAGSSGDSASWT